MLNPKSFLSFSLVLCPFGVRIVIDSSCFLEEEMMALNDVADCGGRHRSNAKVLTILVKVGLELVFPDPGGVLPVRF